MTEETKTPYEQMGYTKDTKFQFIGEEGEYGYGTIVTLSSDDGTICPWFVDEKGKKHALLITGTEHGTKDVEPIEENTVVEAPPVKSSAGGSKYVVLEPAVKVCFDKGDDTLLPDISNLSLLARIILSEANLYNGHCQLHISCKLKLEDLTEVMKELEDHYRSNGKEDVIVEARFDSEGNGDLYATSYWDEPEDSPSGKHTDKLLLSWGD